MTLREALLGGPGLDGYAFNADVYCVDCGREIIRECFRGAESIEEPFNCDSETLPRPIFFGESPDCAQHCGNCQEYLYGEDPEEPEADEEETD